MVGVFIVMWLAALMTLAASGMQHRQLASRFLAYTGDRASAFVAADRALLIARNRLTAGEAAEEIAAVSEFNAGPDGVIEANHRDDVWYRSQVPRWRTVDWNGSESVIGVPDTSDLSDAVGAIDASKAASAVGVGRGAKVAKARYFVERIAFSSTLSEALTLSDASVRRYRVSAMGCGALPGTRVFLQAIYEVRQRRAAGARRDGAAASFSSRLLSWREVMAWHGDGNGSGDGRFAPQAGRERCDAS